MKSFTAPFTCSICKTEFRNPISLVKHVELEHPTTLTLSSLYFKTHPEGEDFINPNMYIPQEMVYQPPKKTGVSLFVQRKPIKASKVCIMVK